MKTTPSTLLFEYGDKAPQQCSSQASQAPEPDRLENQLSSPLATHVLKALPELASLHSDNPHAPQILDV